MIKKVVAIISALMLMAVSLSSCVVVNTGEEGKLTGEVAFDAKTIVAETWEDQLIPDITDRANDIVELINDSKGDFSTISDKGHYSMVDSGTLNFIVKGTATVAEVSKESQAGTMVLTIDGVPSDFQTVMQIGPVIKGSSVRDSLTYIDYGDYTNQTEWGQIKTNINTKILSDVIEPCDVDNAKGKTVEFVGCFTVDTASAKTMLITPVTMTIK